MKRILFSFVAIAMLFSCDKVKKDAETLADLKCLALKNHGDKRDMFEQQIELMTGKYKGEDLVKLEKLSDELLNKNCSEKIKADKESAEFEKEVRQMDKESSISTDNDISGSGSSSSNEDINQMLDDYEEYTDQYLEFYKKAMSGDASAMTEYPELMEKATELQESLQKAEKAGQMNAEQLKRMNNLAMKYMDAFPNG